MNKDAAHNWYRWVWFSPLTTIPTLAYFYLGEGEDFSLAIFLSAGWHLVLLIPSLNKEDKFIRWHGRQARLLAGLRTLTALIFSEALFFNTLLLVTIWFFGTRWGQKQAKLENCSLVRWVLKAQPITTVWKGS